MGESALDSLMVPVSQWGLPFSSGLSSFLGTEQASSRRVRKIKSWDYFVPLPKEAILTRGDAHGLLHAFLMLVQPDSQL